MKVICTRCGGTNIACEAIVNPNTGKIIDYLDESFMHANCGDCKEEVVITDVDRVKKDIDSMFFKFVKKNGKEPEYVECQIVWKDTGDDQRTTIKLSLSITIRKMNKIIEDYKKIVAGNEAGKNICFMSRGEYADPKIAYNGILMNYWDVYDCMDEVEEPTDDDWLNAVSNLFDSYTYDIKNTDVDKFKMSDVMNVYRIINL